VEVGRYLLLRDQNSWGLLAVAPASVDQPHLPHLQSGIQTELHQETVRSL